MFSHGKCLGEDTNKVFFICVRIQNQITEHSDTIRQGKNARKGSVTLIIPE